MFINSMNLRSYFYWLYIFVDKGEIQSLNFRFGKKLIILTIYLISLTTMFLVEVHADKINIIDNIFNFFGIKIEKKIPRKEADLVIVMLDVGHGDSILIRARDENGKIHSALIDTGSPKYSEVVLEGLRKNNVEYLDFIMISHLHSDHMGCLGEIIKNIDIKEIILPNYFKAKSDFSNNFNIRKVLKNKKIKVKNVKPDQKIPIGKTKFDILYPIVNKKFKVPKDLNETSIIGMLKYKNFKMLFTGDTTSIIEKKIINNYSASDLKCNILKLAHHGSYTSSSLSFLKKTSPQYALISSGLDKDICYPHPKVATRLNNLGIKFYNTRIVGNIYVFVNEKGYRILHE